MILVESWFNVVWKEVGGGGDANEIGGAFCPEFDIMEANIHAYRAVNHHCDAPVNGHYTNCDRHGSCAVDIITDFPDSDPYGPGP